MGINKSLKSEGKLIRDRNVYSRYERIRALKEDGRWKEGESVFGLPKLKIQRLKHKAKKAKKEAAAAPAAAGVKQEEKKAVKQKEKKA